MVAPRHYCKVWGNKWLSVGVISSPYCTSMGEEEVIVLSTEGAVTDGGHGPWLGWIGPMTSYVEMYQETLVENRAGWDNFLSTQVEKW